jgi:predicted Zn finger-like uncharacterized protein
MAVPVICPGCRTSYPVTEDLLGKKIRCKKCQETFTAAVGKATANVRRPADERITTRPKPAAARYEDDEDDVPQRNGNGRGRPIARPAAKKGGNGLLIGGIVGGVLLLAVGVGLGVWMLGGGEEPENAATASNVLPIGTGLPINPADVAPLPPPTVPKAGKTGAPTSELKTADAPEKLGFVRDKPRPNDFRPDMIEKAKKSAVLLTVTTHEGLGNGSGWIAERHGNEAYVITNSHVVGMKEAAKPPPEKIDVCFDAGLPSERHLDGKLLALDREEDLAVVRVKDKDLPAALTIAASYDLIESQQLKTMGFPLGSDLARKLKRGLNTGDLLTSVKVRPATVAGRIFNKDGSVKYIQTEGGADPGNSGGAVVDTNGNVVAVVVGGAPGTNMRFVIPSEYVISLLLGRVLKVVPGQAISSGGGATQPIIVSIADPLKRLLKVDAEIFVGAKPDASKGEKPIRASGDREPQPNEGDGPRIIAPLNYDPNKPLTLGDSHTALGVATLPPVTPEQVYWFQPHYYAKDGTQRWGEAIVLEMGRYPVEAKPAHLATKYKEDVGGNVRRLEVDSRQVFGYHVEEVESLGSDLGLKASLTERITSIDPKNGDAKVRIQYLDLHLNDNDTETIIRKQLKGVLEQVKRLRTEVTITKDGKFVHPVPDVHDISLEARPILTTFNRQIIESLEILALSLPGKDLKPGDTWDHGTAYTFTLERNVQNAVMRLTCKFVGTRVRDGREEAVVEISGTVTKGTANADPNAGDRRGSRGPGRRTDGGSESPPPDNPTSDSLTDEDGELKTGLRGFTRGAALVDIATGLVTLARTESDLAVIFPVTVHDPENPRKELNVKAHAGLYLDVTVNRSMNKDAPKVVDVAALLPNQPRVYNPLVGVGTPTMAESAPANSYMPERNTLMAPEVWDRVKHSAVMIRAERNGGDGGEGSGWFAGPGGIIVTNCHVVGMLNKADRPPEKLTVFIDRGTEGEQRLDAELLAIDRDDDLAIIRAKSGKLPAPMTIGKSTTLNESDRLSVLGFPYGTSLKEGLEQGLGSRDLRTTLKARPTTVSGRVHHADRSVKFIQFEGGADHGNSGGAIVDSKGEVRAILVAGFDGQELRWGIPSEYADRMLQGYPMEVLPGRSYVDGSIPKQPINIRFTDPLNKLSAVAIDYWIGNPGKPRLAAETKPATVAGDGPRQSAALALKAGERPGEKLANGDFVLPEIPQGQVLWLQSRFTNGTGKEQWGRATAFAPDGPPVERKPVKLEVKHKAGTRRDIELATVTNIYAKQLGGGQREGSPFKVELSENVLAVNKKTGTATVNYEYKALELDLKKVVANLEDAPPDLEKNLQRVFAPLLNLIRGLIAIVDVTKDGQMKRPQINVSRLPPPVQPLMILFNKQILTSLQATTFPLPGKEVPYGYTWDFPTNLFLVSTNKSEAAVFKMKFKYVGVRDRGGRQEAIVQIAGSLTGGASPTELDFGDTPSVPADPAAPAEPANPSQFDEPKPPTAPAKRKKKGLYGVANGYAFVDVRDGFVSEVKLFIDLDIETTSKDPITKQEVPVDSGGTMELFLRRRTTH